MSKSSAKNFKANLKSYNKNKRLPVGSSEEENIKLNHFSAFNLELIDKHMREYFKSQIIQMFKDTKNDPLIAFTFPEVKKHIEFIKTAILFENARLNHDSYPLKIYDRYKSNNSTKKKIDDWNSRHEKQEDVISDFYGMKIITVEKRIYLQSKK